MRTTTVICAAVIMMGLAMLAFFADGLTTHAASSPVDDREQAIDLYNRSVVALNGDQYVPARQMLERANEKMPDDPRVLCLLGFSQRQTDLLDDARVNLERAIELRPNFPTAREMLGDVYLQLAMKQLEALSAHKSRAKDEYQLLLRAFITTSVQATEDLDHEYVPSRRFERY